MTWSHMGGGYLDRREYEKESTPEDIARAKKDNQIGALGTLIMFGAMAFFGIRCAYQEYHHPQPTVVESRVTQEEYEKFNRIRDIRIKYLGREQVEETDRMVYRDRYNKLIEYGKSHNSSSSK